MEPNQAQPDAQPAASPTAIRQPIVAVAIHERFGLDEVLATRLLEAAEMNDWRLLDLRLTGGSFGEQAPAGALVSWLPTDPIVQKLKQTGCPLVRLGRLPHPDDQQAPAVLPDLVEAGRMAANHFAQRGFRALAVVGYQNMESMTPVADGYRERADAHGCVVHQRQIRGIRLYPSEEATARRSQQNAERLIAWLNGLPGPLGVLFMSPMLAAAVGVLTQRQGVPVPEAMALLALGEDPAVCNMAPVPISSIDMNRTGMVRLSADLLKDQMAGKTVPHRTFVPPREIITRRSTDILAVADPAVAQAIRFLWDHLDEPVGVDDVAVATGTPRRKLERLFQKHLGRSIHGELQRARLARFASLLRTTNHPIRKLAPMVGYGSGQYLHRAFRKHFEMTPRQYRLATQNKEAGDKTT